MCLCHLHQRDAALAATHRHPHRAEAEEHRKENDVEGDEPLDQPVSAKPKLKKIKKQGNDGSADIARLWILMGNA